MLEFTDIQSSVFQYASFRNAKGGILGYKKAMFCIAKHGLLQYIDNQRVRANTFSLPSPILTPA